LGILPTGAAFARCVVWFFDSYDAVVITTVMAILSDI